MLSLIQIEQIDKLENYYKTDLQHWIKKNICINNCIFYNIL